MFYSIQPNCVFLRMSLTLHLPDIEEEENGIYVIHEKFERFIDWHTHSKGQLSYIDGGIAYITVESTTLVVPSHFFFWIPAGLPHVLRVSQNATHIRSIYFSQELTAKDSFFQEIGIFPASELIIQMIQYTEQWSETMRLPNDPSYLYLQALLQVLMPQSHKNVPIILPISDHEKLKNVLDYLEKHLDEIHTLKSVSNRFNTSERTLSRVFQSELKMSFLQYLKHLRMIHAIELLQKTDLSLSEIADRVGYLTLGAFSNTFFEMTSKRPSEMRKLFYGKEKR